MPYGLLHHSIFRVIWQTLVEKPNRIPLASKQRYWMWDTLGIIGNPDVEDFENIFVIEGLSGIYMNESFADSRGLLDGTTIPVHLATWDYPVGSFEQFPQYGFPKALKLKTVSDRIRFHEGPAFSNTCIIGLADFFDDFDVLSDSGLHTWTEVNFKDFVPAGSNIQLKRKDSCKRLCRVLGKTDKVLS